MVYCLPSLEPKCFDGGKTKAACKHLFLAAEFPLLEMIKGKEVVQTFNLQPPPLSCSFPRLGWSQSRESMGCSNPPISGDGTGVVGQSFLLSTSQTRDCSVKRDSFSALHPLACSQCPEIREVKGLWQGKEPSLETLSPRLIPGVWSELSCPCHLSGQQEQHLKSSGGKNWAGEALLGPVSSPWCPADQWGVEGGEPEEVAKPQYLSVSKDCPIWETGRKWRLLEEGRGIAWQSPSPLLTPGTLVQEASRGLAAPLPPLSSWCPGPKQMKQQGKTPCLLLTVGTLVCKQPDGEQLATDFLSLVYGRSRDQKELYGSRKELKQWESVQMFILLGEKSPGSDLTGCI